MTYYKFDTFGRYDGSSDSQTDRSTTVAPAPEDGKTAYWSGDSWVNVDAGKPAVESPAVPDSVTMRQARLALFAAGKLAAVQAAIDALSEPTKTAAQIEWDYSNEVQRHNGLVSSLGPALNLTSEQIDTLFVEAAKL